MKHYEVVCALIFNEEGKVLCTKRGKGRALEGKWEFPGGKVEPKETHEETIIREIKEELSADILPIEYLGLSNYEYHDLYSYQDFSITLYAYRCKLVKGDFILSEHVDKRWATKDEMKDMDFAQADVSIIDLI